MRNRISLFIVLNIKRSVLREREREVSTHHSRETAVALLHPSDAERKEGTAEERERERERGTAVDSTTFKHK